MAGACVVVGVRGGEETCKAARVVVDLDEVVSLQDRDSAIASLEGDSPTQTVVVTSTTSVTVIVMSSPTLIATLIAVATRTMARTAMIRIVPGAGITPNDYLVAKICFYDLRSRWNDSVFIKKQDQL